MSQDRTLLQVARALKNTGEYNKEDRRVKIQEGLFGQFIEYAIFTEIPQCINLSGYLLGYQEFTPDFNTSYFSRILKVGNMQKVKRELKNGPNEEHIDDTYGLEDI